MLTAVGTLVLAVVTAFSSGVALWLPRIQARRQREQAEEIDQRKCYVANMQLKSWSKNTESGRIVHVGWPSWYPIRPVMGKPVSAHGAYGDTSPEEESECQVQLIFEPDDPQHDMWFLLFYDPEGNRRILLSAFPRNGYCYSEVYPAPYDEDPTFRAIDKCPEIESNLNEMIQRNQGSPYIK